MDEQTEPQSPEAQRQHAAYLEQLAQELPLTERTRERLAKVAAKARADAEASAALGD